MFLIRVPDDAISRLLDIAKSQGRSLSDYSAEISDHAIRAHELSCSSKDTIDLYEGSWPTRKQ